MIPGSHCHLSFSSAKSSDTYIIIIVVVIAIVLAIVTVVAVVICQIRRNMKNKHAEHEMLESPADKRDGSGDSYSTANAWYPDYKLDGTTNIQKMEMELPEK